jgi:acetyl esterase/lipase
LKLSEEAAKQRISRAIRQLRSALEERGVSVAPVALPGLLLSLANPAPPASLFVTIVASACKGSSMIAVLSSIFSKMWIRYAAAAFALVAGIALVAVARHQPQSPRPGGLVYSVPGIDQVQVEANQTYLKIPQGQLWYDVYRPSQAPPRNGWPVIVLIHGGPVAITAHPKDWPVFEDYGRVLAASGFAVVTFNYRFTAPDALAIAENDVTRLLELLRADAKRLSINPDRICLWAFSGGGTQLSLALRQRPPYIRCLVSFYAILGAPAGLEKYSPLVQCLAGKGELPPIFVAKMGEDNPAINQSVDAFIEAAKRRGPPPQVVNYAQGVHAFDIEQNTDESRKVIGSAIEFVKQHLLEK